MKKEHEMMTPILTGNFYIETGGHFFIRQWNLLIFQEGAIFITEFINASKNVTKLQNKWLWNYIRPAIET